MKLEFHHVNFVSEDIEEMDIFYQDIMQMETIPPEKFPRTAEQHRRAEMAATIVTATKSRVSWKPRSAISGSSPLLRSQYRNIR